MEDKIEVLDREVESSMATPPSQQKKRKAKKQGMQARVASESPSTTRLKGKHALMRHVLYLEALSFDDLYHTGPQKWTPCLNCSELLVPSGKVNNYPMLEGSNDEVVHLMLSSCSDSQPGGVINTKRKLLYATVSSISSVDVGVCVDLHAESHHYRAKLCMYSYLYIYICR